MRPGARHRLSGPRCERLASGILRLAFCGEHSASQELAVRFSAKETLRPPCGFSPLERRGSDSGLENSYFPKLELPPRSRTSSFGNLETRARGPRGSGSGERALSFLQVDAPRLKNGRLASGKELSYSREASRFRTSISTKLRSTELQFKQKSAFTKRKNGIPIPWASSNVELSGKFLFRHFAPCFLRNGIPLSESGGRFPRKRSQEPLCG